MGMSMRRYLPAMGTAGLLRYLVSGLRRVPRPPPRMRQMTLDMTIPRPIEAACPAPSASRGPGVVGAGWVSGPSPRGPRGGRGGPWVERRLAPGPRRVGRTRRAVTSPADRHVRLDDLA